MRPWIRLVNEGLGIVGPSGGDDCSRGIRLPQGSKEIEMMKKVKRLVRRPYQLPMSNTAGTPESENACFKAG
jgi:hypothetical protein